ncbi:MAG TPA: hypothetical protein VL463_13115 [Kofleriaceae bacterium]|jgi:hypothetical protein|nr:hypothetical protein [Kofleriaceae bacterium]
MASETTTSTYTGAVNASLVQAFIQPALSESPGVALRMCREINLIGQKATAAKIATETPNWGSPNDDGAGVDTEFDATQGTALGNTAFSAGSYTCTPTEYGVAAGLTDNVSEDSVLDAGELLAFIQNRMLHILTLAWDDDYLALLVSLSNVVGVSGSDLTIAQMLAAQQGIRVRGALADGLAYILDNQQASDLESALIATSTSMASFAPSADRLIGYNPSVNNGMGADRMIMQFRGYPVVATGLTDTANAGADVVGACVVPSSPANDNAGSTTHVYAIKRLPTFEMQRQAKGRLWDLVMTSRIGFAEAVDGAGTSIVTDA